MFSNSKYSKVVMDQSEGLDQYNSTIKESGDKFKSIIANLQ
jgi:hypothetical protein